jgi:hypothetical protein
MSTRPALAQITVAGEYDALRMSILALYTKHCAIVQKLSANAAQT